MALSDDIRKHMAKLLSSPEAPLNLGFSMSRIMISVKAQEMHREKGLSKQFVDKWEEYQYKQLIKQYNEELKKIRESQN